MRVRIAVASVIACFAMGAVAVPTALASNGTPVPPKANTVAPLYTVPISGLATNHKQFKGTFGIQRFVVRHQKVYALGTLKGRLGGVRVTRYNVTLPASLTGAPTGVAQTAAVGQSCPILHLVLGPINLNLLGLRVKLGGGALANQPIVLDITAQQGPGNLLGNLLCGITNSLNQTGALTQLGGDVQQLAATLNSLTSLFGALNL
ncbi:MAG TPA: hypothetical protein VKR21_17720 [Solirubrobacteraceae bacterium]|nr:hypothetical protein [Solirubrobacteraceae bacterium]